MPSVYILAPTNLYSGGPELLHQLCFKLRQYGYDAKMYYYGRRPAGEDSPIHPLFQSYQNPVAPEIEDVPGNFLVFPEGYPRLLQSVQRATPVIWWLSVDNYPNPDNAGLYMPYDALTTHPRLLHLVQSEYARRFVLDELRIPKEKVDFLGDYLREDYFSDPFALLTADSRLPYVLFNPLKGMEFTGKIIEATRRLGMLKHVKWMPINGYTPRQLAMLMQKAMLYIDFGNHPGMDRLPREAAISGCCVITGRRGAAAFPEDIPIPEGYKFRDEESSIPAILATIEHVLANYDRHIGYFAEYRAFIAGQENRFERDMTAFFTKQIAPPFFIPRAEDAKGLYEQIMELHATIGEGLRHCGSQYAAGDREGSIEMSAMVHEALFGLLRANQRLRRALERNALREQE